MTLSRFVPARRLMKKLPILTALGVGLFGFADRAKAQTPPTENFIWNNFVSSGTTWSAVAGGGNWLTSPGLVTTALTAGSSSIDNVFLFNGSNLQTVTGYTSTNNLGAFNLNAMVFNANSNVFGGVTITNNAAADSIVFNASSTGTLPAIWQQGSARVTFSHNAAAPQNGITIAGGASGTTLQILGSGTGDVYLNTDIAQTGGGASGLLINQTGNRPFFTGSVTRLGGRNSSFTGGVTLTSGNLMLSNLTAAAGTPPTYSFNGTTGNGTVGVGSAGEATVINSLGTGTLTINGANTSVQFDPLGISSGASPTGITGTFQVNNPILLNSTLNLTGSVPATAPGGSLVGILAGNISGTGGLNVVPTGPTGGGTIGATVNYALTGSNTFTGPLTIQPIGYMISTLFLGTATSAGGSLTGPTSLTIGGTGTLNVNNTAGGATRLSGAPALNLNSGNFTLFGAPAGNVSETVGALTVNGMGVLTVASGGTATVGTAGTQAAANNSSTLTIASLNRGAGNVGTLNIVAGNLGLGTGVNEGIVVFTANPGGDVGGGGAAGSPTVNLLPYAAANTRLSFAAPNTTPSTAGTGLTANFVATNVFNLVRWDSTTSRIVPLNFNTEYASNLYIPGLTPATANQRFLSVTGNPVASSVAGLNSPVAMNALVLDSFATTSVGVSVSGTGTLSITGGTILSAFITSNTNGVTNPSMINVGGVAFGSTTAYVHTAANLVIASPLTGSGGLVKSQSGTLVLAGANGITGGLSLNAGALQFTSDANLGAPGAALTLNNTINTSGLQFQQSTTFSAASALGVTINRPITVGAGGGSVNVTLANNNMILAGSISGSSQLNKLGAGVTTLTGANTYTGALIVTQGILVAQNDAALGAPGAYVNLNNGTFQPGSSFSTSKDFLLSLASFVFTGGNNLTINGTIYGPNPTTTQTFFKTGLGDLTLTNSNPFIASVQLGESTPVVRASSPAGAQPAGRMILSGANGSIASASAFLSIGGGELILDNTAAVNNNRIGTVTLSLIGGNATLLGNAAQDVAEQVGSISLNNGNNQYGGRLTLSTPAGSGRSTTLFSAGAYTVQAAPNVGTLFVRGTNLGSAVGDRTAVIMPVIAAANLANGLVISMVGAGGAGGATAPDATDFIAPATIVNPIPNANQNSLTIFTAYTAGTGALGAGAATSTFDVTAPATFAGTSAANALRIQGGGGIDLGAGTLTNTSGLILTTGGANAGIINGTLNYAAGVTARFSVAAGSDLSVPAITGTTGGLNKLGTGVLTLNGAVTTSTGLFGISAGTLRYGIANALPTTAQPFINSGAILDLNNTTSTLGGLIGWGDANIGTGSLTLSTAATPILSFGGGFIGSGSLIKTGTATQVLSGNSPSFSGQTQVLAGTLTVNSNGALGSSTAPILLGDTSGAVRALLNLGTTVTNFPYNITVQAGSAPPAIAGSGGAHTITAPAGTFVLSGNIAINNTSLNYTTGGVTLNGIGLQFNGASGVAGGNGVQTGVISGPGGLLVFSGNWTFNGNNTFTGGMMFDTTNTTVAGIGLDSTPTAGVLTSGPFGTGSLSFSTTFGINLRADGGARTIGNAINLSSTGSYFGVVGTNPLTLNGNVDFQGSTVVQTWTILNSAVTTFNGNIQNGTGGLTKNGPGTVVLTNGGNSYSGTTTINAGVVLANNTTGNAIPGAVTVNAGAILGGTGSVSGPATINARGIVSPGASPGILTINGGLTMNAGSIFTAEVNGAATAGTSYDQLRVTSGTVTLTAGAVLDVRFGGYTPNASDVIRLLDFTGTTLTGEFTLPNGTALPEGSIAYTNVLGSGIDYSIFYNTLVPNQVVLSPVPEPASLLAIGGAICGVAGFVRRRRLRNA